MQESPASASATATSIAPPPPKPSPRRFVVRVEADPRHNGGQARLTEKDGKREKLVMDVPIGRVRPRLEKGEIEAFFWAELDGVSGVLDLADRAPKEKEWSVYDPAKPKMLGPGPDAPLLCPCGAPRHKDLCRDAQVRLRGGRNSTWRAPGMEASANDNG